MGFLDPEYKEELEPVVIDNELPEVPVDQEVKEDEAVPEDITPSNVVVFCGREFEIKEPDTMTVLAFLNFVGTLGVRANRYQGASFKGLFVEETKQGKKAFVPPAETIIFSLLSVLVPSDVAKLAILVFFGGTKDNEQEGARWLKELKEEDIVLAPIIQGLMQRLALAKDLRDSIKNLQIGAALINLMQTKK